MNWRGALRTPSIINKTMKKNIFILLVSLLSCQLTVSAQSSTENSIDIEICSDTTIVVRDLFGTDCILYGDITSDKNGRYGGDQRNRFENKIEELNYNGSHKYIFYNNQKGICIDCKYDEMSYRNLKISLYGAINKGQTAPNWCPDTNTIYTINIIKKTNSSLIDSIGKRLIVLNNNIKQHSESFNKANANLLNLAIVNLIIICLIIVMIIRIRKIGKKVNNLKVNRSPVPQKSEDINIDEIKQTIISSIQSKDVVQQISNNDIYNIINRPETLSYIQNIIENRLEDYLRNKVNMPTPTNNDSVVQQPQMTQQELRTTKVEYRAENQCFIISEKSKNKIFEIYSVNNEFYYTIVKDASIRKEMLGFITAFPAYVETRQDSPIPSTVEVIRDGRLIKDGDMYKIDSKCKLQVSLQ